jgi:hypothetical protein
MTRLSIPRTLALAGAALCLCVAGPAFALTAKECSAKYQVAKTAGSLNGMGWNEFRKSQCGSDASSATTAASPAPGSTSPPASSAAPSPPKTPAAAGRPATSPAPAGTPVYPTTVSSKYSNESAGKARMHTCLDQYNANKASNANGGLNWIAKGGGYYSECNKRLRG